MGPLAVARQNQEAGGAAGSRAQTSLSRRTSLGLPYVALVLFMIVYCARPEDWIPGLSAAPLAKITAIAALLALAFSVRHIRERMPPMIVYLGVLIVQLFLASLLSPVWRVGALQVTIDFAKVLLVTVLITSVVTTLRRLRVIVLTHALSLVAISAATLWKGHQIMGRLQGFLNGNYADPNDMALAIVIALPLCAGLMFLSRRWFSIVFWSASMLVMIYVVFLTGSRGGVLALAVVAAVCAWEFAMRGRRYFLLGTAFVGVVILWQFAGGMMAGRIAGTFDVKDTAAAFASGQQRQELFWRSIKITAEHPLLGVGPGNFDAVSGQWHTTHNSFTLMSSEAGIPALILYSLILWCGFRNLNATKHIVRSQTKTGVLARALFASLAGYVVGSSFLSVAYQFFPYILVAYTAALLSIARKAEAQSRQQVQTENAVARNQLYAGAPELSWPAH